MSKKIQCLNCTHFAMWDGDPCCVWKLKFVLPDLPHQCKDYERETHEPRLHINDDFWKQGMQEFFRDFTIKDPLYSRYIKLYPERKSFININTDENSN